MSTTTGRRAGVWVDLGLEEYLATARLQDQLATLRAAGDIPDTFIALEHPHCITVGRGGAEAHILASAEVLGEHGVAVHLSDRGGDVTYHGPGQLVCYAIVDLRDYGRDVHAHVCRLEAVMMDVAASFGVPCWRRSGYPGVWTASGKIGALGVAVRGWVTRHGAALNVSPDLAPYGFIVPCGLSNSPVTSLAEILRYSPDAGEVRQVMKDACERVFRRHLEEGTSSDLMQSALQAAAC